MKRGTVPLPKAKDEQPEPAIVPTGTAKESQ
jgi:hypothetical protein